MAYTDERKMRMHATERIQALLYELVPFVGCTASLIEAVLTNNKDEIAENIQKITLFRADVEAQMLLNIVTTKFVKQSLPRVARFLWKSFMHGFRKVMLKSLKLLLKPMFRALPRLSPAP